MGSNTAVCNFQILFVYHYPERSNTYVSVFFNSCGLIQRWLIGRSTYRFLLSTLMVDQPPNRKGAIESLKGDESFRICGNPSNWSSKHLLLRRNRDAMHSLLIPPFSIIFTHSYRAILLLQFFASCGRHLLLTSFHQLIPPFSSNKPQVSLCCIITFVFHIIMCVNP